VRPHPLAGFSRPRKFAGSPPGAQSSPKRPGIIEARQGGTFAAKIGSLSFGASAAGRPMLNQEATMGMATQSGNLISSENVEGTAVYDPSGNKIGHIDHLMIDKVSGVIRYAIMTFGGFLGIGEGEHPLPWQAFKYDTNLGGYVTNVTEEQLKSAPQYDERNWSDRDWEQRLHQHFGSTPYWEEGGMSSSQTGRGTDQTAGF
jgi:hypothetical protein